MLHEHHGYRYTVATIANGAQPGTVEAELWYQAPDSEPRKWRYFRRYVAESSEDAVRRVEATFKEWVEGQREGRGEGAPP